MLQIRKRKKQQIQPQRLREDETEFMKVTQPWQDELADLARRLEMKLTKFKETQASIGKLFEEQVKKESLDQAKGIIVEINVEHDKLQDIYTRWFDKTNKIIEERKEQRRHAATSDSGTSHK